MKKGIIVLSLFDGMSCGRIALDRAGIKVKKYYASEIDKYAQIVSAVNYPDIIRLGDITKWKEWKIEKPDIIIGGSPCQGFSSAGKGLNFDDPRSKLFFTFVDILKRYKPKYFLLENVKMKKEYQNVISDCLGVEPIEINSALVSAQNRRRLYWTNIPGVTQPKDKGIFLKDIIDEQAFLNDRGKVKKQIEKSNCLDANYHKGKDNHAQRTLILTGGRIVGRNPDNPKSRKVGLPTTQKIAVKSPGRSEHSNMRINRNIKHLYEKANCMGTHARNPTQRGTTCVLIKEKFYKKRMAPRIYDKKAPTLQKDRYGLEKTTDSVTWRKLTPLECERLQTVPDNFTAHVSNTQRYKMLGNGWTVDVIAHIFRGLK